MKTILLSTAVLLSSFALASAETMRGCEIVKAENGNYFNLVDPTCKFAGSEYDSTGADENRDKRRAAEREAAKEAAEGEGDDA